MACLLRSAVVACLLWACANSALAVTVLGSNFDGNMSLVYDVTNGNVFIENAPLANPAIERLVIQSLSGQFLPGNLSVPVLVPPVTINSNTASLIDIGWNPNGNFLGTGSLLGGILPANLTVANLLADLTIQWAPASSPLQLGDLIHSGINGSTQGNPIVVAPSPNGFFRFFDVTSGNFFDPPMATGYEYTMESNSLFTSVGLPYGLGNNFTIESSEGTVSGLAEGGYHQFSSGVSTFKILGIDPAVDGSAPDAFPVFLTFDTETASFNMLPIPEPGTVVLMSLGLGALLIRRRARPVANRAVAG